jgi:iron-only hydrogenase group A
MEKISITINGETVVADQGKTVLEVAMEHGVEIPSLCFHPDVETAHHCGMCAIEIKGEDYLKHACATVVTEGMEIVTESEAITQRRTEKLDGILAKHLLECDDCVWGGRCKLLELVRKFGAKPIAKKDERNHVVQVDTVVFDQTKCIGCENCLNVCPIGFLEMNEYGKVSCSSDERKQCISCGQCIIHCPVGAIEGAGEFEELEKVFQDKEKIIVVQFAPSIRTSIGEEFGMEAGTIATGKLVSALRKLGFNSVFDAAAAADFTTMEESNELIEKLTTNTGLPIMTSCCPAWVKFVEFYYPEFIPHLATSRSPQIMLGGIIKSYWSKKNNIDPKNIIVVSVMPCVSKKYEIKREELKIEGNYPVDMVLTTRELARLLKKNNIDLKTIDEGEADSPLGSPSGAGVIYGSSGGVFESALRTTYFTLTGTNMPADAVREIRGAEGIKMKEFTIGERLVKVCVVSGIRNAKKMLDEIKEHPGLFDALEVMACPGGCVNGGGQPVPSDKKMVQKRAEALYAIDDKSAIRCAHENQEVQKIYEEFFMSEEVRKKILHTHFAPSMKAEIKSLKNSKETYE